MLLAARARHHSAGGKQPATVSSAPQPITIARRRCRLLLPLTAATLRWREGEGARLLTQRVAQQHSGFKQLPVDGFNFSVLTATAYHHDVKLIIGFKMISHFWWVEFFVAPRISTTKSTNEDELQRTKRPSESFRGERAIFEIFISNRTDK